MSEVEVGNNFPENIKIEKAIIGEYAKEVNDSLLLEFSKENLRLVVQKGNKGKNLLTDRFED